MTHERRPLLGYTMVLVAATLFGVNGSVAKVALTSGLSSLRLTEARSAGACIGLMLIALAYSPRSLRVTRRELPRLAVFGVAGVALVQLFYFLAIHRLAIGIALLIQYLGPVLVAIWARTFGHEHVRRRIWASLALSLTGLALMVELWRGIALDGLTTVNLDFVRSYRPQTNVVTRPTAGNGRGYTLIGHHEIMIPLLAAAGPYLRPGGAVYVEVPDGEAAAADGPDREEFFIDHHHVFSAVSLGLLAVHAGFNVEELERLREPSGKYTLRAFLRARG